MAVRNYTIDNGITPSPATRPSFTAPRPARTPASNTDGSKATTPATGGTVTAGTPANLPATANTRPASTTLPATAGAAPAAVNVSSTGAVVGGTAPGAAPAAAPAAAPMTLEEINKKIAAAEKYAKAMFDQGKTAQAAGARAKLDEYYRMRNEISGTTPLDQVTPEEAAAANAAAVGGGTYDADLDAAIATLLNPQFIGFQGERASELRRLQNLRNQLFGSTDAAGNVSEGSVGRQQKLDTQARRRLAAQRAGAGMLQGGAYAGTERGVGTAQEADQAYAMQELLRPFQEQVASDRLQEFGLGFDPTARNFNLLDFGKPEDIMGGWSQSTTAGRAAAAAARNAAVQQFLARGINV